MKKIPPYHLALMVWEAIEECGHAGANRRQLDAMLPGNIKPAYRRLVIAYLRNEGYIRSTSMTLEERRKLIPGAIGPALIYHVVRPLPACGTLRPDRENGWSFDALLQAWSPYQNVHSVGVAHGWIS